MNYGPLGGAIRNYSDKKVLVWLGGEGCKFVAPNTNSDFWDDIDLFKDPFTGIWYKLSGSGWAEFNKNGLSRTSYAGFRRANDEELEQMKGDCKDCPEGCFTNDYKSY